MNLERVWRWLRFVITAGIVGMVFYLAFDAVLWVIPPERGWGAWRWTEVGPVAVGNGYSITLLTRQASSMLAEYDQKIEIHRDSHFGEKLVGTRTMHMNTGGRIHIR